MAYCPINLAGIANVCQSSKGGVTEIFIAPYVEDMFTLSGDTGEEVVTGVNADSEWYKYNIRKGTCSVTSTLTIDPTAGVNYVANEISLIFARQENTKRIEMNALAIGQVAVVVKDANGEYTVFGVEEPVEATAGTAQTGVAKTDGNNYQLTLGCDTDAFPPFLNEAGISSLLAKVKNA